ncbi:MAG: MBL fold metallo-hydrolase [Clostridia bacterium]|nr:MBL fold metallo-hydrolase [Clostridia bacterium]
MKKISWVLMVVLMVGLFAGQASAIGGTSIVMDGKTMDLGGTEPFVDAGSKTVYLPLRAVAEALGAAIRWDANTGEVVVTYGSDSICLKEGEKKISINGEFTSLDSKVLSKSQKLFVPAGFFEQRFGIKPDWDEKAGKITIKTVLNLLDKVSHYKQSTVKIGGEKTVYIDPFSIGGEPKDADIVFVTHTHGDHFSVPDIKKVMKKDAILVITADGADAARKDGITNIITVEPSKNYEAAGIQFKTVSSYNTNKDFHTKDKKWVGYILEMNKTSYYFSGDTDKIPEMNSIKADVAFLPVGGTYTMTAKEAAEAANIIKPKVAVPVHFADIVGSTRDAKEFIRSLDKSIKGVVLKDLLSGVEHGKQSTIRIKSDKVLYVDPLSIEGEPKDADVIFITHTHGDHYSIPDIKKIMKEDTVLVITADGVEGAKKEGLKNVVSVEPGKSYEAKGIKFETVPSYNTNKDFHPKSNQWVGYIVTVNNTRYYMAGDTDVIGEMSNFNADVAFLPVGGTYTMTAKEAAEAANTIKPLIAVPIHFADVVGTIEDAKEFIKRLSKDITGVLLKK